MSTSTQTQTGQKFGTTADIPIPRGDTTTKLTFFVPPADGSTPYNLAGGNIDNPPAGVPPRNYGEDTHEVTIHDIRGREHEFDINVNGFGVVAGVKSGMEYADFEDDGKIERAYYPEVERVLLENLPGSKRVFIFDHTIRRPGTSRAPVTRAHIDQTARSARMRVEHHMGAEAAELLQGRVRIVNVWRPLNGPLVSSPLAYADSRSVPDSDVVPVEHRYPDRTGETAGVRYTEKGRWYYWSGMTNDERVLLRCADTQDGARTPHTAFVDPRTQPDWPGRESIEVRALVFG